jgi:hypothetical protein
VAFNVSVFPAEQLAVVNESQLPAWPHGVAIVARSLFVAKPSALTTENKKDNEKKVAIICFEKNFIFLKIVFG